MNAHQESQRNHVQKEKRKTFRFSWYWYDWYLRNEEWQLIMYTVYFIIVCMNGFTKREEKGMKDEHRAQTLNHEVNLFHWLVAYFIALLILRSSSLFSDECFLEFYIYFTVLTNSWIQRNSLFFVCSWWCRLQSVLSFG